ncbi:Ankyrin repeat family protein [Theileria parva strain Muguga]|uniref:Uncharacterized protein n=1 Tax=Theileria parva TaxID=5875 RepID=Q4MZH8_THEPA|nr:Ankyrin repeat family protein [Theileria parva strain Muguga]EAN31283.1 Ankyrin repeat family protein [Theileria parva strain Muguga]|eukprot:XP_763566.1 hypothetical protein [Theileria parva strain Muguga]
MSTETVVSTEISRSGTGDLENVDLSTLFLYFSEGKLTNKSEFSDEEIKNLFSKYSKSFPDNEKVYEVFASVFSSRGLFDLSRACLYTRVYLLKRDSQAYKDNLEMLKLVNEKAVEQVLILPKSFLDNLFSRENSVNFNTWKSKMAYTETSSHLYSTFEGNYPSNTASNLSNCVSRSNVSDSVPISKSLLRPGELILKSSPISVAPWNIYSVPSDPLFMCERVRSCFHCLKVRLISEVRIACPKHPCECNYYFCSTECFLRNGAVHELECEQLPKLNKFSEHFLNPSFVLLVARTLIKCRLNMTNTARVSDIHRKLDNNSLLDVILSYQINDINGQRLRNCIEEMERFALFLLEELGFDFCLHLTTRELTHFILVVWVNSVPFTSCLNLTNGQVIGGSFFTLKLKFRQSETPNCVLHFDDGKFTVRSIYEISKGNELTINTRIDKYTPVIKQLDHFWSVQFFTPEIQNFGPTEVSAIRCKKCIQGFCYPKIDNISDHNNSNSVNEWHCETCGEVNSEELNLLQNKAEGIFTEAQKLYLKSEFLRAKSVLLDFISKWSGVLHFAHYLLYNSYLILAGILNRPGSITESLTYLTRAIIAADKVLPKVCHEKAYLYDVFADYLLKLKTHVRIRGPEYDRIKRVIMNSLYNALWNWVVISGTNSFNSISTMQKCRAVAFSLNIHTPPVGRKFVINLPIKYAELVKFATGHKVQSDLNTSDVGTMAFTAAQGPEFNDTIVQVLTSVDALGIRQLGTGLSVLGIVASNLNLPFFTALIKSHYNFAKSLLNIDNRLDSNNGGLDTVNGDLNAVNESLDTVNSVNSVNNVNMCREEQLMNILHSIFGPNEVGVNLLIILACFLHTNAQCNSDVLGTETVMAKVLFSYSEKFKTLLSQFKSSKIVSIEFDTTSHNLLEVNNTTAEILGCQTALHYASFRGKNLLAEFLLRKGALVNCMNLDGSTPLHLAAFNGHYAVAKTLLNHNATVSAMLKSGETPLHMAIYGLHKQVVTLLLEHTNPDPFHNSVNIGENRINSVKNVENVENGIGPTIWHALVCGIFHVKSDLRCKNPINPLIVELVERLARGLEVVKILLSHVGLSGKVWVWCGYLPSQLLLKLWDNLLENASLFSFPKHKPTLYVVSRLNGVIERDLRVLTGTNPDKTAPIGSPQQINHLNKYNHVKECEQVKECEEWNGRNDLAFGALRTFQFLLHILKSIEES